MTTHTPRQSPFDFLICRNELNDSYQLFKVTPEEKELFQPVQLGPNVTFDHSYQMAQVGGYLLQWSPLEQIKSVASYRYNLLEFDPESPDPLNSGPLQTGTWEKKKFWGYRDYYSSNPHEDQHLDLVPLSSFILSMIPAKGRGTFELWNFDPKPSTPGSADPIPYPYTGQGAFPLIKEGHILIPLGNYVLDRLPDRKSYRLWSFDPQLDVPLSLPTIQEGQWEEIDERHELIPIGSLLLDWIPEEGTYRLWEFDPSFPGLLTEPVREGKLPPGFGPTTKLTPFQPRIPVQSRWSQTPGSLDFMRKNIKHVVYYMLESRSFDNVCGWLYEKGEKDCHFIGKPGPFDGASEDNYNMNGDRKVHVSKFKDGKLSEDWDLMAINQDPFHGTTDNLQQMFLKASGYEEHSIPDMGGFILNNANDQVMQTFSPEQLPILNGLARQFGISDNWFSSIPGGTDVNRAFSVTGSAFNKLGTWEGGSAYKYWPYSPRRQSIWKVLWSQGITDWKIYNAVLWEDCVFTYQLYLKGQIPTVDDNSDSFLADMEQFKKDALSGNLPAFSYLEPVWIAPSGATSYHPGADLVPGEKALNDIYNAIKNGPGWENTLFIITFDKNGGIYDHVSPPYAKKPWPNDLNNGFAYDLMGPRVPTVVVSPWIKKQTVFRADGAIPFDGTSFAATLLKWFGIPKPLWGLGDRIEAAPTFERILQESNPRKQAPGFTPPYDKQFPRSKTT